MLTPPSKKYNFSVCASFDPSECSLDYYRTFCCDHTNVTEALADEIAYWCSENPVLIDGRTGIGKTTFVLDVLLVDALKCSKSVLIISNRIALSTQQKMAVLKKLGSPLGSLLTEEGLRQQEHFGAVSIITYHRLPAFLKDASMDDWRKQLKYVIFDEAHFFVADSSFNDMCDLYLKLAIRAFRTSIRVYLTATSWDLLYPLAKAEEKYFPRRVPQANRPLYREFIRYYFPSDYTDYFLRFFSKNEDFLQAIQSDSTERWLIFVDNKAEGEKLRSVLSDCAIFLSAEDKGSDAWNTLLQTNRFPQQVLICTPVLDCGINIDDSTVRNIVVMTDDRTRFIQEIGRKRKRPDEKINLWVKVPSAQTITRRIADCKHMLTWLQRMEEAKAEPETNWALSEELRRKGDPRLCHLYHLHKGFLYPNRLASFYYGQRLKFLSRLSAGASFQEIVYDWLGQLPERDTPTTDLDTFFLAHGDTPLTEELEQLLRSLIVKVCTAKGYKEPRSERLEQFKHTALNNRLSRTGTPYRIKTQKGHWVLYKINSEKEDHHA